MGLRLIIDKIPGVAAGSLPDAAGSGGSLPAGYLYEGLINAASAFIQRTRGAACRVSKWDVANPGRYWGTGAAIGNHLILTAYHVVDDWYPVENTWRICFDDTSERVTWEGEVVAHNRCLDYALISVKAQNHSFPEVPPLCSELEFKGLPSHRHPGSEVFHFGYPSEIKGLEMYFPGAPGAKVFLPGKMIEYGPHPRVDLQLRPGPFIHGSYSSASKCSGGMVCSFALQKMLGMHVSGWLAESEAEKIVGGANLSIPIWLILDDIALSGQVKDPTSILARLK